MVGIQKSKIEDTTLLPSRIQIGSGTLLWIPEKNQWIRAGIVYGVDLLADPIYSISLFVSPGAQYQLEDGTYVRDAMEVYSPDTKKVYAEKLLGK